MSELLRQLGEHMQNIPFMVGAVGGANEVNKTRIIEALVIAGMTAMMTSMWTADRVAVKLEERVAALVTRIERCEGQLDLNNLEHRQLYDRLAVCEAKIGKK